MVVYCNNQAVITSHYSPTSPEQQPSSRMAQAGGGGTSVAVTYTSASPLDRQSGIQSKLKITISPHGRTPNLTDFLTDFYQLLKLFDVFDGRWNVFTCCCYHGRWHLI